VITVNATVLLASPVICTVTLAVPTATPDGTVAEIELSLQLNTVAAVPLNRRAVPLGGPEIGSAQFYRCSDLARSRRDGFNNGSLLAG
jgi:hypothetical protein